MKRNILLVVSIALFLGCASNRHNIATSFFYQVGKADTVRVDSHSVDLIDMRVLIVSMQDTTVSDFKVTKRGKKEKKNTFPSYIWLETRRDFDDRFFNGIVAHRVTERLKGKTKVALVESRRSVFEEEEVERLNTQFGAGLVAVIRGMDFTTDLKERAGCSVIRPSGFSRPLSFTPSSEQQMLIGYRVAWDLFWLDDSCSRVQRKQTIVHTGGYNAWISNDPLEKVLSCALKAGDDFCCLFK